MITEQDKARKKLQKIKNHFNNAGSAVSEGDLEKAVNYLFDGIQMAKNLADDVNYFEQLTGYKLAGFLSNPEISKSVEPVFKIADKIKDKDRDNKYTAIADFMVGVAYFAQRKYELSARYLQAAKKTFQSPEEVYSSLMVLSQVYRMMLLKKRLRETYIEAMLVMPKKYDPFEFYANGVLCREQCCTGFRQSKRNCIIQQMRKIITKCNSDSINSIDKKLVGYIAGLGRGFREYYNPPIFCPNIFFHLRTE